MAWKSLNKVKILLEMIKFEHTLFALPFAYMGMILGSMFVLGHLPAWSTVGWVTLAMVGARSAAMALNRLIDRAIDAKNPRTSMRAIPAGLISIAESIVFIVVSFVVFFYAAFQLNPLAVKLMPIVVFVFVLYSYTKRFTWACHLVLGVSLGLAPMGGWVAATGQLDGVAWMLFFAVALWTAGFDIIYACQDIEFDRQEGLYSIPSRFGIARSLTMAKVFHVVSIIGLASLFFMMDLSWFYLMGIFIANAILHYEHRLVSPTDLSKLNTAFFTMNGILSVVVFIFTFLDVVV